MLVGVEVQSSYVIEGAVKKLKLKIDLLIQVPVVIFLFSLTNHLRASLSGYGSMSGETMIFQVDGASQCRFSTELLFEILLMKYFFLLNLDDLIMQFQSFDWLRGQPLYFTCF